MKGIETKTIQCIESFKTLLLKFVPEYNKLNVFMKINFLTSVGNFLSLFMINSNNTKYRPLLRLTIYTVKIKYIIYFS